MKKFYFLALIMTLVGGILQAQAPQGFNYQAVVRNSSGQIISNREVNLRLNILQGSETGNSVYSYTGHVMTNTNGVITVVVGENSPVYAGIDWGNGPYFLQSEIDVNNGTDFDLSTTQQILSVPYAQYAAVADHVSSTFSYNENDPLFRGWGYLYDSLINAPTRLSQFINDVNFITSNDLQLSVSGDTLFISGGNFVILPNNLIPTTMSWDSIIGHPTNLSQFINDLNLSDFNNDINFYQSGDTLFFGDNYVVLNGLDSIDWNNIINKPTNLSQFFNDLNLSDFNIDLNFYQNGDTIFFGDSFITINGMDSVYWDSIIGRPTNLSQFFNDLNLSDFNNDLNFYQNGDTIFFGDNFITINGMDSVYWDSIIGRPTNLSQFFNDLNLSDFNNDLNFYQNGDTIFFGDSFITINGMDSVYWDSIIGRPTNLSQFFNDLNLSDFNNDLNFYQNGDTIFFGDNFITINGLDSNSWMHYTDSVVAVSTQTLNIRIDSLLGIIDSLTNRLEQAMQTNDSVNFTVDSLVHPSIPGLLPGKFSIGTNRKVQFSKGNLQYKPNIRLFRFADNQYAIGDNTNVGLGDNCTDWIDLFPYGTSGWAGGRTQYMPNSTGVLDFQYAFPSDLGDGSLTGYTANGDWGIYNPIINGGNQMATWRTLTDNEWNHLLNNRANASNLKTLATVNGQKGIIILPDDWEGTVINMSINTTVYETNNYNTADWEVLEDAGAVFLPSAGWREGITVNGTSSVGYYWSATRTPGQYKASAVFINVGVNTTLNSTECSHGCSVRLVRDY